MNNNSRGVNRQGRRQKEGVAGAGTNQPIRGQYEAYSENKGRKNTETSERGYPANQKQPGSETKQRKHSNNKT